MTPAMPKREIIVVAGTDVHVWRLDLDAPDDVAKAGVLSADELGRAEQFREQVDRERWIAGRAALRRILSAYVGVEPGAIRFRYNEFGKPAFADAQRDEPPLFNMSRAGRFALCAVARCEALGIDLQRIPEESVSESLVRHYCSPPERLTLERAPATERQSAVCQLFAYKEAYVKARGVGFSLEPDEITIGNFLSGEPALVQATGENEPARWVLREVDASPGHRAALAIVR
jgi:4'-phosphopantetheinyl transferase